MPEIAIINPFGLYKFVHMPFGLRNTAHMFQHDMLGDLEFCFSYIDDLLIARTTPEELMQHLKLILEHLENHGLLINVPKIYLGCLN